MIGGALIALGLPVVLGVMFGWWRARASFETIGQFFISLGIGASFAALAVFSVQMIWLGAVMMNEGGVADLAFWALYWTVISGVFWLPIYVITLVFLALRKRKSEASSKYWGSDEAID